MLAGLHAAEAALALGRLEDASRIAEATLGMARQAVARGQAETALRDLSVSLDHVGDTALRLGNFEEAEATYRESLEICRMIRERIGDTPETLRDLSVSLINVGDNDHRLGNIQEAEAAWRENLKLLRRLAHAFSKNDKYLEMLERTEKRLGDLTKDDPDY